MTTSTTPPPDDVDMDSFAEGNDTHCFEPPPHIAARFYRKSSARRKSSAHSSRRSSLSSLHSHHSTLSCHGGPQSNHIAQHLRRASIIESRKARLADRAAHAEQVRLRAAIAKAAPRGSYREERVLAAQAAREKLLAEIAARCEEEVRRAKKIAEETKEKKAAEHARMKEEMAEKFAEAARRRVIYQSTYRRPRTTSLAAVAEEKKISPIVLRRLSQTAAARVIQRAWRAHRRRKILSSFTDLELNLARVKDMSFEDVTKLISEDHVLSSTASMLRLFGILEPGAEEVGERGAVRVFLSTFLILAHPVPTFSHGGKEPQEQDVMAKGQALLEALEACIQKELPARSEISPTTSLSSSSPSHDNLTFLYNDFSSAFHAWKSQDLSVIIDVMVNSFVNLDLILQATAGDHDGHVRDDYLQAVRQEQIKLLVRLKKLAGPEEALSRVRTAVRKARKQRAQKARRQPEGAVPRTSSDDSGPSVRLAPTIQPASAVLPAPCSSRSSVSASSLVSRLGQTMTVLPSNREIAHEMLINGTYEVQQQPWTESRKHFMDSLRSSMRESMRTGSNQAAASWTHAMAVLIRDKLLNLTSPRHPLYSRIDGFLDPKLIEQQCRNNMFSYTSFFETIAGLIGQICSPGRDELVQAFAEDTSSDTIDRLFALINIVDIMTLDHINFQFRLAAPSVIEHGHEHEQSSFEEELRDNVHQLERTRRWWAVSRANAVTTSPNTTINTPAVPPPSGNTIYARGLTDLVFSNTHLSYHILPETLRLDWPRLLTLRARGFHIVAVASILLTTKIRLRRNREALWTKDADRLMNLDVLTTDAARIVSLIESSHMMPESTKEGLLNFVGRVIPPTRAAARNAASAAADLERMSPSQLGYFGEPAEQPRQEAADGGEGGDSQDVFTEQIATFVLKSLREHVFLRLSAVSTADKARATASAAEVLARAGMPEFVAEVNGMVGVLERVRAVDFRGHGGWYDRVALAE